MSIFAVSLLARLAREPFNPPDAVGWFMATLALILPAVAYFYLNSRR